MPNVNKIQATVDAAMFNTSISHKFDMSSEALEHILNATTIVAHSGTKKHSRKKTPSFLFTQVKFLANFSTLNLKIQFHYPFMIHVAKKNTYYFTFIAFISLIALHLKQNREKKTKYSLN